MNMNVFDLNNNDKYTIDPKLFPVEPIDILFPSDEIASLSTQVEKFHIDVHTQSLQIEVERVKCQKLRSTMKQTKCDVISSKHILAKTRN